MLRVAVMKGAQILQVMEAKWAAMRFTPFLVIDPVQDASPLAQDAEEYITQVLGLLSGDECKDLPSWAACMPCLPALACLLGSITS